MTNEAQQLAGVATMVHAVGYGLVGIAVVVLVLRLVAYWKEAGR